MTPVTKKDYVARALRALRVLGAGETLDAMDEQDGSIALDGLFDLWAGQRLTMYHLRRTERALPVDVENMTIGPDGDIDIVRPEYVDHAALIIDTSVDTETEIPIDVYSPQRWASVRQKRLQSTLVQGIYPDFSFDSDARGLIWFYPIPTIGTTALVLYTPEALTQMDKDTKYTHPPGYYEFILYSLCKRLAPEYGKVFTQEMRELLADARATVKRKNIRPLEMRVDDALLPGGGAAGQFNYRTGE